MGLPSCFRYAMAFCGLSAILAGTAMAESVTTNVTTSVGTPVTETTVTKTTGTSAGGENGLVSTRTVTTTKQPVTTTKTYTFSTADRSTLTRYLHNTYASNCRNGLYSYDGSCITVDEFGKVKRTYVIGQPLPETVTVMPLPGTIATKLSPAPEGYYYTSLDHDVLLVEKDDNTVVDAVSYYSVNE